MVVVVVASACVEFGQPRPSYHSIGLQGGELCADGCTYPAPYISEMVFVNSTSPLRSIDLYVNGTFDYHSPFADMTTTPYAIWFKASAPTSIQISARESYELVFVATFEDGVTCNASTVEIASG
jgi:hypothetical protein